ncbi:MAG TPA: hypothetical protein VFQ02_11035, partial [Nitrospira sp.]|nr:hypothetical protein [Nitrospira sp.]
MGRAIFTDCMVSEAAPWDTGAASQFHREWPVCSTFGERLTIGIAGALACPFTGGLPRIRA